MQGNTTISNVYLESDNCEGYRVQVCSEGFDLWFSCGFGSRTTVSNYYSTKSYNKINASDLGAFNKFSENLVKIEKILTLC